jgi:hypothetical protein
MFNRDSCNRLEIVTVRGFSGLTVVFGYATNWENGQV